MKMTHTGDGKTGRDVPEKLLLFALVTEGNSTSSGFHQDNNFSLFIKGDHKAIPLIGVFSNVKVVETMVPMSLKSLTSREKTLGT